MKVREWFAMAMVAAVAVGAYRNAEAAVITSVSVALPGFSTGSIGPVGGAANVAPNNDNSVPPSPNLIPTTIFLNAGGFGIIDLDFLLADSGGTTEYFHTPFVINNSGVTWTDFHFQLGFGSGANFVPAGAGIGLDFDTPTGDPTPTSSVFTALTHGPTVLNWNGGTVNDLGSGGPPFSVAFSLSIDVPDGLAAIHPQGLNRFTLRAFPTAVPEPGTLALIATGLGFSILRRRRGVDVALVALSRALSEAQALSPRGFKLRAGKQAPPAHWPLPPCSASSRAPQPSVATRTS
jgi:hypothetical protein